MLRLHVTVGPSGIEAIKTDEPKVSMESMDFLVRLLPALYDLEATAIECQRGAGGAVPNSRPPISGILK